jgi:small subunit ribosomal protein S4
MVDGERVNIPSYLVEPGQVIQIRESALQMPDIQELAENRPPVPGWLEVNDGAGRVLRDPERNEIDQHINETAIVEFYSR